MVYNCFVKCKVCGSITRIRLQIGFRKEHPVVLSCGKCRTSLLGHVTFGQETTKLDFKFDNANIINYCENEDYLVECSGEFPVEKQCKVESSERYDITPFIRTISRMRNNEAYIEFRDSIDMLDGTAKKWKDYKRILDLFQNQSIYVIQEIQKIFEGHFFQCRDELEVLRAVHLIEVMGFYSSLKKEITKNPSFYSGILQLNTKQTKKLIEFLNTHDGYHLEEMQSLIYKLLDEFIEVYQALIPALSLQYCKDDVVDFEVEGSTTSTFDMIKPFYLDVYEALGNLLIIPVALNNIKYRGDFDKLAPNNLKAQSLEDFIKLAKGKRYQLCIENEMYTGELGIIVNKKIRNAIGHNDVLYDTIKQLITYIPDCRDRTKKKTEYLLEFENEAVHMFQGILTISEYLYRLRELKLIFDGNIVIEDRESICKYKKVGRNEQCPCGSGKKYKYCHGRN